MNTGHPDPSPRSDPLGLAVHTDLPGQAGVSTEPELGDRAGQLEGQHRGKLRHPKKKRKEKKEIKKGAKLTPEKLGDKGGSKCTGFPGLFCCGSWAVQQTRATVLKPPVAGSSLAQAEQGRPGHWQRTRSHMFWQLQR